MAFDFVHLFWIIPALAFLVRGGVYWSFNSKLKRKFSSLWKSFWKGQPPLLGVPFIDWYTVKMLMSRTYIGTFPGEYESFLNQYRLPVILSFFAVEILAALFWASFLAFLVFCGTNL